MRSVIRNVTMWILAVLACCGCATPAKGGRLVKVAECPPPGDGWTWRGLTLEDGFEIGHWIRRKAAKRDE